MKNFEMQLTRSKDKKLFKHDLDERIYKGRCTLDSEGMFKGYLEYQETPDKIEKTYVIGIYDEKLEQMVLIQFYNEELKGPYFPNTYLFDSGKLPGLWQSYNYLYGGFFFSMDEYDGKATIDLQEIADFQLSDEEKNVIDTIRKKQERLLNEYLDFNWIPEKYLKLFLFFWTSFGQVFF